MVTHCIRNQGCHGSWGNLVFGRKGFRNLSIFLLVSIVPDHFPTMGSAYQLPVVQTRSDNDSVWLMNPANAMTSKFKHAGAVGRKHIFREPTMMRAHRRLDSGSCINNHVNKYFNIKTGQSPKSSSCRCDLNSALGPARWDRLRQNLHNISCFPLLFKNGVL